MKILTTLSQHLRDFLKNTYNIQIQDSQIHWNETRPELEGEYTLVVFPLTALVKKKPEEIGREVGNYFLDNEPAIQSYDVVKGFVNITFTDAFWLQLSHEMIATGVIINDAPRKKEYVIEFCSPNTNKPLHLGHVRNILLGDSISRILESVGHHVIRTQVINDKGIAISKSMLAWKLFANGDTPQKSGIKGDHFVGDYYVMFNNKLKAEYKSWQLTSEAKNEFANRKDKKQNEADFFKTYKNKYFNSYSVLGKKAREMLQLWEGRDENILELWKIMNQWVYEGFEQTFHSLGIAFDSNYYESDTYLIGNQAVDKGLDENLFYQSEDGSIWVDLESKKLDKKILRRADGTSLYITQDIGTAKKRYEDYHMDSMVYVVGNEQEYHFQVLFEILKLMKVPYAASLFHLSYGMVELPDGKMKSREGNVVDADEIISEVINEAQLNSTERGELEHLKSTEKQAIYRILGLGALKFFILRVNAQKTMLFDPKESVNVQGQTGPYVQNAYVRIQSIKRKALSDGLDWNIRTSTSIEGVDASERDLIHRCAIFSETIHEAVEQLEPSIVTDYCYQLAKSFHKYYHDVPILRTENKVLKIFRLKLIHHIAETLASGMQLLGIEMPERM